MVGDAEFRKIWLWGSAVSSSAAGRSGRSLAGLDVGLVDEAVVEDEVVKAVVEEEVVEACGLERVGGVLTRFLTRTCWRRIKKIQITPCPRRARCAFSQQPQH